MRLCTTTPSLRLEGSCSSKASCNQLVMGVSRFGKQLSRVKLCPLSGISNNLPVVTRLARSQCSVEGGLCSAGSFFAKMNPIWRHQGWGQPGVGPNGVVHYGYTGKGFALRAHR